jgi:hypothetical protein
MLNEATRQFIRNHRSDAVQQLALHHHPTADADLDLPEALIQIAGRQAIAHKIPTWYEHDDLRYPTRLALEQCSSEVAARYKASLLEGRSFVDLTGGFGVDTAFIAARFERAEYVEQQANLVALARHNFPLLGLPHIQTHCADARNFLKTMLPVDCLYLDPARRDAGGRKMIGIADCEPNLLTLQDSLLSKADHILIKLSPMLDVNAAQKALKNVHQIHIISIDHECKELLFLLRKGDCEEATVTCIHLNNNTVQSDVFTRTEEKSAVATPAAVLGNYLYEPNPSLLKGGFFRSIAQRYAINKLHRDSHLYTSDRYVDDFPGRIFYIESVAGFNKKELKILLRDVDGAHLSVRNFPVSVRSLRRQLRLKEGDDCYFFATTRGDGRHVLVKTRKVDPAPTVPPSTSEYTAQVGQPCGSHHSPERQDSPL